MRIPVLLGLLAKLAAAATYDAQYYTLIKDYGAGTSSFWSNFNFYTGPDPKGGFVDFMDATSGADLYWNYQNASWISADFWTSPTPNGRPSLRLEGKDTFSEVLIIADFVHAPGPACGAQASFWTRNPTAAVWPEGGEVDILQGANTQMNDYFAYRTTDNCTIVNSTAQNWPITTNCFVNATGQTPNTGCAGWSYDSTAYGAGLNAIDGGVYALDWRAEGIRTFWFPRSSIPSDILAGNPTTANWSTPMSDLPLAGCDITSHFFDHQIVFDITFCADQAAPTYSSWGCPGTCSTTVSNNATLFNQAYFGIQSLKVYQSNGTVICS